MNGDQYLNILNKKYAGINRGFQKEDFNTDYGIYEPIKLSPDNTPKSKFKSTIRKTNKFFRKMRITFGIKARVK